MTTRIAQIGIGHVHAPGKTAVARANPAIDLVGIYERDPALRATKGGLAAFQDVRWFDSADDLLGDPTIQGVLIETTPFECLTWAHQTVAAGKHVHIDKAPGTSYADLAAIVGEATRRGLLCQPGYHLRSNPGVAFLFEAVRAGLLGEIQSVRGRKSSPRAIYDSLRAEVGRSPGGMFFYIGCHLLDLVVALLGRPTATHAVMRRDNPVPDPIIDNTLVVLEYPRAVASLEVTALEVRPIEKRRFEVYGSAGSVILEPVEPGHVLLGLDQATGPYAAGWQEIPVGPWQRYVAELAEFADCIAAGRPLRVPVEHDLLVQETLLRACGLPVDGPMVGAGVPGLAGVGQA